MFLSSSVHGLSFDPTPRRDFVLLSSGGAAAATLFGGWTSTASSATEEERKSSGPIGIVGASGRTGSLCVTSCLNQGIPVRALTRSGSWSLNEEYSNHPLLTVQRCDVKNVVDLNEGVVGCQAVIYAASASKKGGKAKEIDNEGVVATAQACLTNHVKRYVVISSTATTRPKSLGYLFTNVYQNIMAEKRLGELGVQSLYTTSTENTASASSYVILRPGGLEEPKSNDVLGPSTLELSQGDALAGIISRADLAELAVQTALSPNIPINTSFECYYTESVQPCEKRFQTYLTSSEVSRLHGDTYDALFQNLHSDGQYFIP